MSLITINKNSDLIEFDEKNYFFRVADIFLENNEKISYVNYLQTLTKISDIIQDFRLNEISKIYSEESIDGVITSNISEETLSKITKINKKIIDELMKYETNNFESTKLNTNIKKELIKICQIINDYDIDYYMNKAFKEWIKINQIIQHYLTINIKFFNEVDDDNIITKLLTYFNINIFSKSKEPKRLIENEKLKKPKKLIENEINNKI